jgi:hypothetical protein
LLLNAPDEKIPTHSKLALCDLVNVFGEKVIENVLPRQLAAGLLPQLVEEDWARCSARSSQVVAQIQHGCAAFLGVSLDLLGFHAINKLFEFHGGVLLGRQ